MRYICSFLKKTYRFYHYRKPQYSFFTSESRYDFINRQKGSDNLMLIVAGFQPFYWDVVLKRVKKAVMSFPEDCDVCVCIPMGVDNSKEILTEYCNMFNWSLLCLRDDLLSQAQNSAIKLHPKATWIYKIDEDIIIGNDYFKSLKQSYLWAENNLPYKVGFAAPTININAVGVLHFLKTIGEFDEFEKRFGKYQMGRGSNNYIHDNGEVAEYIWNLTIPFDEVCNRFLNLNIDDLAYMAPVRFSVGAVLFKREFWEKIGFFKVNGIGAMGVEEVQMNNFCNTNMLCVSVATKVLVGHLGFFKQKDVCRSFFENNIDTIK